jgi:hypothetical protein
VVRSNAVPAMMASSSCIATSCIPTAGCISAVPDISASADSSDWTLSAFKSSESAAVECWWRIEGRRRDREVGASIEAGLTVGDRSCGGGRGVVGEVGCDLSGACVKGVTDPRRSRSRTGRKPSTVSMDGPALASGWISCREDDETEERVLW